jgi:hypothetical protein
MPYTLDLSRFGFIWFSEKPDEGLPFLNKVRLIQARERNPNVALHLIYSSHCLNPEAIQELKQFTGALKIRLIDFDTDLQAVPKSIIDAEIYNIAQMEIEHAITKKGGNMKSASDCLRILECFLEISPNYVDFDTGIRLKNIPSLYEVKRPVIFSGGISRIGEVVVPCVNTYFVGVSMASATDKALHPHARSSLNHLKVKMLQHYLNPSANMLLQFGGIPNELGLDANISAFIHHVFITCQNNIFKFRQALFKININPALQQKLYEHSVSHVTGPFVWFWLFADLMQKLKGPSGQFDINPEVWLQILKAVHESGFTQNGLENCIVSRDTVQNATEVMSGASFEIGDKCDNSWIPAGSLKLQEKSQNLEQGVKTIQAASRGLLSRKLRAS